MDETVGTIDGTEDGSKNFDFVIDVPSGRDIKILQLSDLQNMELSGIRNNNRYHQIYNAFFADGITDQYVQTWRYVDEAVQKANPDVIVLAGDIIYGQTDDDGSQWLEVCYKMDSYKIPWLVLFGNHDNESAKGVRWQIEQVQSSQYGIIKQGDVTGNSNYTVGLRQDGEFKQTLYILDTNGCKEYPNNPGEGMMSNNVDINLIKQEQGIYADQMVWMKQEGENISDNIGDIPALVFMHIPIKEALAAMQELYPDTYNVYPFTPNHVGDTGKSYESFSGIDTNGQFWALCKELGVSGMFFAHQHSIATSIVYDGVRLSFGLKTSTHDSHKEDLLGSLAITIDEDNSTMAVNYLYSELPYQGTESVVLLR